MSNKHISALVFIFLCNIFPTSYSLNEEKLLDACRPEDGYFKCNNGVCRDRKDVLDGGNDCGDGSDETTSPLNCTDDEFRCRVSNRCIPRHIINTRTSCTNKDSIIISCQPEFEFECPISKKCIQRWKVQNGIPDCGTELIRNDQSDELLFLSHCNVHEFSCVGESLGGTRCIPRDWVLDGWSDCTNSSDEEMPLPNCRVASEFRCISNGRCIARHRVLDGYHDCLTGSDELQPVTCHSTSEFRCSNGRCIPRHWRGNGLRDCPDGGDEVTAVMTSCMETEFLCRNRRRCVPKYLLCDGVDHCGDCSDEIENCTSPLMFRCPNQLSTCIHRSYSCDSYTDCPDNKDDIVLGFGFKCLQRPVLKQSERYCVIPQRALHDQYPSCDDDSDLCFQDGRFVCARCLDLKTIISPKQVCDGVFDCPDLSDECLCSDSLKNISSKLLCDSICYSGKESACRVCPLGQISCGAVCITKKAICDDKADCTESNVDEASCTKPDLVRDQGKAPDFSCDKVSDELIAFMRSVNLDSVKELAIPTMAKSCDNVTECKDMEDECNANCSHRPAICDEVPLFEHYLPGTLTGTKQGFTVKYRRCSGPLNPIAGASVCNGIEECPRNESGMFGVDELDCPERFYCDAGQVIWPTGVRNRVSINASQRCDAKWPPDCLDMSDEINCGNETHFYCGKGSPFYIPRDKVMDGKKDCSDLSDECPEGFFDQNPISSRQDMIKHPALKGMVWLMSQLTLWGNAYVIAVICFTVLKNYQTPPIQRMNNVSMINNVLILNLAVADFLMGVALIIIATMSVKLSGQYCRLDKGWRTSVLCGVVGSLTSLSSESSVLTLVCMAAYRAYTIFFPISSRTVKIKWALMCIMLIWIATFTLALLPFSRYLSPYMVTGAVISNSQFFHNDSVSLGELNSFAERAASLSNSNAAAVPPLWYDLDRYLKTNYPEHAPKVIGLFGYYSANAVCIPRYFLLPQEKSLNVLTVFVVSFNFTALLFIAVTYAAMHRRLSHKSPALNATTHQKGTRTMQRKITVLILTDMCCWLPICLLTFISIGNRNLNPTFSQLAYAVSATVLLPINSSLNPLIYSGLHTKLWNAMSLLYQRTKPKK